MLLSVNEFSLDVLQAMCGSVEGEDRRGVGEADPRVLGMLPGAKQVHLLNHGGNVLAKRPEDDREVPFLQPEKFTTTNTAPHSLLGPAAAQPFFPSMTWPLAPCLPATKEDPSHRGSKELPIEFQE
jgi:hypothetical protein